MADKKTDKGQGDLNFTDEQQAFIDKLVGKTRIGAREKAQTDAADAAKKAADVASQAQLAADKKWQQLSERHEARVKELEPFEAQAKAYTDLIDKMLKAKVKELGDAAKKAVQALPEALSPADKLSWLAANEGLFKEEARPVGSPKLRTKPSKAGTEAADVAKTRRRRTL